MYQILPQSVRFCRLYIKKKPFGVFSGSQCITRSPIRIFRYVYKARSHENCSRGLWKLMQRNFLDNLHSILDVHKQQPTTKTERLRYILYSFTNHRRKVGAIPPTKIGGQKTLAFLLRFSATSRLNGEYLLNETWHRQSENGAGKYKRLPTSSENFVNFGLQTV